MVRYGLLRLALQLGGASLRWRTRRQSAPARLAALSVRDLPIAPPVEIAWNDHLVPFVTAESDRDLAVALGVIHAHLRLAQIEIMRHAAQGRLSEMLGPVALDLDHTIRVLDPTRAVPAIEQSLPPATRDWLEGFVDGINHHLGHAAELPLELRLLGVAPAPWRVRDVLDIARLAAADVTWLLWRRLLPLRRGVDWPQLWRRLLADETAPSPTAEADALVQLVGGVGVKGSNAFAVAGNRTVSGRPWLGGDPHLSLTLPSVWLAAAYRSPSYNVAGLMIPGIPVMAIGRNRHIAWGGTNLHAASSELFDVAALPRAEIIERRVALQVRWARRREIVLRDTPFGPVLSDAPHFAAAGPVAFKWVGHFPSDEMTALLAVNRARSGAEFRTAAQGFAVPGQTLVYAETAGGIGRIPAVHLPRRSAVPPPDLFSPAAEVLAWDRLRRGAEFPAEIDPPGGVVVSANDRPPPGPVPVGWFFSPRDRAARLAEMLSFGPRLEHAAFAATQRDTFSAAMLRLRDRICAPLPPGSEADPVIAALLAWDGRYEAGSAGALAFELVLARLTAATVPPERCAAYRMVWHGRSLIADEFAAVAPERLAGLAMAAARASGNAFAATGDWGGAHRLRLSHPLGQVPLIGRRWRGIDWGWPGSGDTVLKSGHGPVAGRHAVTYGSNARYLFDMADPNANFLVLLGGQDGVLGSAAFADQLTTFQRGEYIQVPLDPEAARASFPHRTVLQPSQR